MTLGEQGPQRRSDHATIPRAPIERDDLAWGVAALDEVGGFVEDLIGEGIIGLARVAIETGRG